MRIVNNPEMQVACPKCNVTLAVTHHDITEKDGVYSCKCCNCGTQIELYDVKMNMSLINKFKNTKE